MILAVWMTHQLIAPAAAERIVAVAPFTTLSTQDTSAETRAVVGQLEAAIAGLPQTKVVPASQVADGVKRAKKPALLTCEGDAACLGELAKLVNAQFLITGEVGGLGDARVVYLSLIDTASAKEVRSTTLRIGAGAAGESAVAAATRLIDPDRYRGVIRLSLDVAGATIYVNGTKIALAADKTLTLPVGTHALRVTHPEYRDFVRFVDVVFAKPVELAVAMAQYPVVRRDIHGNPVEGTRAVVIDPPLWRRWYVIVPAAVVLGAATGAIVGTLASRVPDGTPYTVRPK